MNFVQIGVTALRGPKGEFLEAVPLYVECEEDVEKVGLTTGEKAIATDYAGLFARRHREYIESVKNVKNH